jgi:hypothetical protein
MRTCKIIRIMTHYTPHDLHIDLDATFIKNKKTHEFDT